jgi:hypothetical protein
MTIIKLMTYIGIVALVVTALTIYLKKSKNYGITYLQHFAGILFLVSGFVKAVDPLGTAFKTEQYFDAFYYTLKGLSLALWRLFSHFSISMSMPFPLELLCWR